jgi:hypothetical protein
VLHKHNLSAANGQMTNELAITADQTQMTPPPMEPRKQPSSAETPISKTLKFSKKRLALAFAIAGISDAIGAFATPLPPIVWVVDLGTALLLFMVLGRQWLLLPGLALEAIPGLGVLPFWLLVVGAIAVLGTPRPIFEQH